MSNFVLQPVSTAQWHALVSEAEAVTGCVFQEPIERYLVTLLMRFTAKPHLMARVWALDYLNDSYLQQRPRRERLREIGDQSLLFTGLFPRQAEQRQVRLSYFVGLGQSAYQQLHEAADAADGPLYARLAEEFVALMDLLQAMRELRDDRARMTPLHAFDLWSDTGSRHAFRVIRTFTRAVPVWAATADDPLLM